MPGDFPKGWPTPRWRVHPLRRLEGEVAYRCPDERCGEGRVTAVAVGEGPRNRCPTCHATVVPDA